MKKWLDKYQDKGQVDFREQLAQATRPIVDRGNFSTVPWTQTQQMELQNAVASRKNIEQRKLQEEISARQAKEKGTAFTLPTGSSKKYKDMNVKERAYVDAQSLKNKGRWNENEVEQPFLNMFNPATMLYDMAAGIGEAPLMSDVTGSKMPYVTGIGVPLVTGALAGIGANNTRQFVNNLANPFAGFRMPKRTNLNLEELRRVYHNRERYLLPEEAAYLHKHGHGLRENYRTDMSNFGWGTNQWNVNNLLAPPPSEIQFMPDGSTRTIYSAQSPTYNRDLLSADYANLVNGYPPRSSFMNYPNLTREEVEAAWRNLQSRPLENSSTFKPKITNKSGLTKDEAIAKASAKDKNAISKMSEKEFEESVLKPTGEVASYKPGPTVDQMTYNPDSRRMVLKDMQPMSRQEYVDAFNKRLDLLNDIIAKKNKSGVEYRVKELTPDGRLIFYTPAGQKGRNPLIKKGLEDVDIPEGTSMWQLNINPGEWKGNIEDIANTEYFRSIPGLEMSNTTSGVFADNIPRKGTAAYESINEYLKRLNLGRVKPGFNSQTEHSRNAWENFIKSGRGYGFYGNPSTVYGAMKNVFPYAVPATIGAAALQKQQQGGPISDNARVNTFIPISQEELLHNYISKLPQPKYYQFNADPYFDTPGRRALSEADRKAYALKKNVKKAVKVADVATDLMQIGNFIPIPQAQVIGKFGNTLGAGIDALQAGMDIAEGNYGNAAINFGASLLPNIIENQGYTRDMWNTTPGSYADRIANFGSRNGKYIHLTPYANQATNPVIMKGVNFNRGLLGTLGAETVIDLSQKQQGGIIKDDRGQWSHPGKVTQISSPNITMANVNYPVLGVGGDGQRIMMYPNQEYQFNQAPVTEYPMMQLGGIWRGMGNALAKITPDYKSEADRKLLFERYRPIKYPGIVTAIAGLFEKPKPPLLDSVGDYNIGEEAWAKALGLKTKDKYLIPSPVRPLNETNKSSRYYQIAGIDPELIKAEIKAKGIKPGQHLLEESLYPFMSNPPKNFKDIDPIQNFQIGVNKNGKPYIYDKYDFDFEPLQKVIRPYQYEIYQEFKQGGEMIKRADGSYSRRGLWDNIRANKGSGKQPTKEMLEQERKIKAKYQGGGENNFINNNLFNQIFRNRQLMRQEILNEYPALQEVMSPENMNIAYARGNQRRILKKEGHNPEYFDKDNNQNGILDNANDTDERYPYTGNITTNSGVVINPNPGEFTTLINKRGMNRKQIKQAAANDFISHALHYAPQYQEFSNQLQNKLLSRYPKEMIEGNGGVDAYMRSIFTEDPSYAPYKQEMSFIDPTFINQIKSYVTGNKKQYGGDIPVLQGPSGYMNEDNIWVVDNKEIIKQAKALGAKKVLTEGGSLIIFDDNWNIKAVDDNPSAPYKYGGGVTLNAGGEKHRIYIKPTNRGEGVKGHVMVNHPTMDKGEWDTIDLTEKAGAKTIAQGVAATKKWHRENPYKKQGGGENKWYYPKKEMITEGRSHYSPNTEIYYINPNNDPGNEEIIRQHELFHHLQNINGAFQLPQYYSGPLKKPSMIANDEAQAAYYNRRGFDEQLMYDKMRHYHPDANFISRDLLYNGYTTSSGKHIPGTDDMMYEDPSTLEGEARQYENYIRSGGKPIFGNGGYVVRRSHDRKGKTHVVIGPDGTKKYFGDAKLGQHPNDPARKKAFYARHKHNLAHNPYFRAFARATWETGGEYMQGGGEKYTIKSGDTLSNISKQYNIPLNTLANANNLQNPDLIKTGNTLVIPKKFDRELRFEEIPTIDDKKIVIDNFSPHYDYIIEGDKTYYKTKNGKTWADISDNTSARANLLNFINKNNYWAGYGSNEKETYLNPKKQPVVNKSNIYDSPLYSFLKTEKKPVIVKTIPSNPYNTYTITPTDAQHGSFQGDVAFPTSGLKSLNKTIFDPYDVVNNIYDMYQVLKNGIKRKISFYLGDSDDLEIKQSYNDTPLNVEQYYRKYNNPNLSDVFDIPGNDRQFKSEQLDLSTLKFKPRNRGEYSEFNSEGMPITIQNPFVLPRELKLNDNNSVIGIDNSGNFVKGQFKDFKNRNDVRISRSPMNRVLSFDEDANGISRTKPDTEHGNKNFQVPVVNVLSEKDNKTIEKGSLNILTKPGKENFYGSVQGGRFVMENPDNKKTYLVSGSLSQIKQKFKEIKGDSKYVNVYTLDNGTYSRGLAFKDNKFTQDRLRAYDNENLGGGGNGLYITGYDLPINKYKEEIIQNMPNIRNKNDKSYKEGHKLKNEIKNIVLHHTAYTNPLTNNEEVRKQYMTPGNNSSHIVIEEDGKRVIYASPEQVTFHAGESKWNGRDNVNDFSIGVEFQGDTNKKPLTQAQIESFAEYYAPIAKKYNLSLKDLITHQMIAPGRKPDISQKEYSRILKYMQSKGYKKTGGEYMAIGGQSTLNPRVKKDNRNWLDYLKD